MLALVQRTLPMAAVGKCSRNHVDFFPSSAPMYSYPTKKSLSSTSGKNEFLFVYQLRDWNNSTLEKGNYGIIP